MYISNLKISNFRNINQLNINFNKEISIILGENNIGKSNLLDSLNLIFNSNLSFRKRILEQEDFYNGLTIHNNWPEIVIETTLSDIETEDELAVTSKWLTRVPGEAKITYKFRPKANISTPPPKKPIPIAKVKLPLQEYEWIIFGGEIETTDNFDFNMLSKFEMNYVEALRDATTELKKSSNQLQNILKQLTLPEKDLGILSKQIEKLNEQIIQGENIKKIQGFINSYLSDISGSTKQQIKINMGESDYSSIIKNLKILIGANENIHSVDFNGLGYNNLLYISLLLTYFSTTRDTLKNHTDYIFPILIIEEPEAHLHSHLQKFLADYFFDDKFKGQVIMTTHSSHISSHANLDSLILIYKNKSNTLSKRIGDIFNEKTKEQKEYKRYLERWLDATKSDIFFGRKVLLVEGIAERLLIPKFFSILYKDSIEKDGNFIEKPKTLEGEGISIISVDGVAFRPFLHLYNSDIKIPCAVLTDSDPDKVEVKDINGDTTLDDNGKPVKQHCYPKDLNEINNSARTQGLINDFKKIENIGVFSNLKTFEYDLIKTDNEGFFRRLITEESLGSKDVREKLIHLTGHQFAIEAFNIVKEEKGILAQLILDRLQLGEQLNIPQYIQDAFKFLMEEPK